MKILNDLFEKYKIDEIVKSITTSTFSVLVESKFAGMASTFSKQQNVDHLNKKPVSELIKLVFNDNLFETAIGIASLNSIIPIDKNKIKEINAKNLIIEKGKGKNVAVIGHFPFVEKMGDSFSQFHVFEKNPTKNDIHADKIPKLLPEADVVAITGATFVNKTFMNIMENIKKTAYVIVLGPSTPNSEILFDYGVDAVCGSIINNISEVKTQLKFAKRFRELKGITGVSILKDKI